jgi:hypothetical protein
MTRSPQGDFGNSAEEGEAGLDRTASPDHHHAVGLVVGRVLDQAKRGLLVFVSR